MRAIVAYDSKRGIGKDGAIPWRHPEDLRRFSAMTRGCVVIMGRGTWESLPPKFRPLPKRANVVLSRTRDGPPDGEGAARREDSPTVWARTVEDATDAAIRLAAETPKPRIFVIGGASIYREFLRRGLVAAVDATEVVGLDAGCDRTFPALGPWFRCVHSALSDTTASLRYETFMHGGNAEEQRYLDLVERVIDNGVRRADRTGVGTRSVFGAQLRFDLSGGRVPLLTTKKVFWRGIVEELLWFLRGDTDAKVLSERGVRFWDANGTREFLDGRGLDYPEGCLGPVYGWQWRRFGAPYTGAAAAPAPDARAPCGGGGADQVKRTVELLRRDPTTRRAVISAWNPNQLDEMALPPCHVLYQFWVSSEKRLHCAVYQRSGDLGLGIPFNIASAALLTHLMARATGTVAHELVHFVADAHVYETHVGPLRRQLRRTPRPFPTVALALAPSERGEIWDTRPEDIELAGYHPCLPTIKMPMAV